MAPPPLLGHGPVRERLARAADAGTLHHAYLFEGPRGLGKRRVAEWLALYTNCLGEQRPCGACARCGPILAGTHPDVIVLEPDVSKASRIIAVAAVRDVIRKAGYHRFDSARRFVIVDPADAMQDAAANALLKTLEEPPEGTGFILVAASARGLLPTIVSRCQRIRFGAVPTDAIEGWLRDRGFPNAAVAARAAMGCPGRALELVDGGLQARVEARDTVTQLASSTSAEAFAITERALKKRTKTDWSPLVERWFEVVEELLRDTAVRGSGAELPLLHPDAVDVIDRWVDRLYPHGIDRIVHALEEARQQLRVNANGRLVLDAFFARLRAELA